MPKPFSEIISRASQLGGPGSSLPLSDGDLFKIPNFEEDFVSERFPHFSGHISLRYPSFGDEVDIEAYALVMGGTVYARICAALSTCLESAPPSWWAPNPEKRTVDPAIGRITDSPALIGLYNRWIKWRDTFRVQPAGSGAAGTDSSPEAALGGVEGSGDVTVQL
jgi:hypothetical protein